MENQDFNSDFQFRLSTEFQKIDKFLKRFRVDFTHELSEIKANSQQEFKNEEVLNHQLQNYATQIWGSAESVIDKDNNYTEIRLKDEVSAMERVVNARLQEYTISEYSERLHLKAKALLVKYFPQVFDLTGDGFRLLEKYCLLYNLEFMAYLENHKNADEKK
ncbi:hypothetical protein [Maribellus sediminis]|uniref:hypothetical protein n=1 Tax=Maribellus sediminis TaxID=2696285 RepID=UPI00142FC95B|nr:hypothetical protein [Maribellus sediminis]